jgi:hypothetical protein
MKWKALIASAIFLVLYSFSSCKKDSSNNAPNNPNKLKLYIEDATNTSLDEIDTFNVTYDGDNRITSLSSPIVKFVYTYNSNNTFSVDLYDYGQLNVHEIDYINSASLVDSSFQYNDTNDSTTEGYLYSGKTLIRKTTYDYSKVTGSEIDMQEDYTYDNNGNMITDIQSDGFGNVNTTTTFTYTDKILNYSTSPIYLPIQSKDLPATQTQTDGSGNHISMVTYSYVFDSSGRVTKETDAIDNGESIVKSYVYY